MSGCNTDYCRNIKRFVESLVADTSTISVFEEANHTHVYVRKAGETLKLDNAQTEWLDEAMKQKIREFVKV